MRDLGFEFVGDFGGPRVERLACAVEAGEDYDVRALRALDVFDGLGAVEEGAADHPVLLALVGAEVVFADFAHEVDAQGDGGVGHGFSSGCGPWVPPSAHN
ncbi:hypothetical protein AB0N09_17040 [Streptomyces erythrochromogenes]|uniref:hypothetical protein n=1 Tax=Streptomyces erythrochromogenes TaxID=285574 RepID=UPI003413BE29